MAKLVAQSEILMPDGVMVRKGQVFDATPAQAKQFDALKAARPARAAEIKPAPKPAPKG